jgi:hypothetical protein
MKNLFLLLAIFGFVLPYYFFVLFLIENGFNLPCLLGELEIRKHVAVRLYRFDFLGGRHAGLHSQKSLALPPPKCAVALSDLWYFTPVSAGASG